jgi:hypothetical protein
MSALPPEADMLIVGINVCYVPVADIVRSDLRRGVLTPREDCRGLMLNTKRRNRRGYDGCLGREVNLQETIALTARKLLPVPDGPRLCD